MLVLDAGDHERVADLALAERAVRHAFEQMRSGEFTLPQVLHLDLADRAAEIHAKGAYLHDAGEWTGGA